MKLADLQNPIALAKIIAASNANSIPIDATGTSNASQTEGFPAITMIPEEQGGEAPHGLDFNGFLKMLSSHVYNIQNGTPETFNPAVSSAIGGYPKNAQLWLIDDNNSRLLKSTRDDNTDNFLTNPSVIGTSWVEAFPTKDYVDNNFVTLSTAQTITGTKIFSVSPLVPTATSGDSTTKAASTAFVGGELNSLNNTVVHLAGAETITGVKTFTAMPEFVVPTTFWMADNASYVYFVDGNNVICGALENRLNNIEPGSSSTKIFAECLKNGGGIVQSFIEAHALPDGTIYSTCSASDRINSIVNTVSKLKSGNGCFELGNGLIVQWGHETRNSSNTTTINYPKAFSGNDSYKIVANPTKSVGDNSYSPTLISKSTQQASFYLASPMDGIDWIAIGY